MNAPASAIDMAAGRDKHVAYLSAIDALGRGLARRAKSKCELSGRSESLTAFDLEGPDVEPDMDHVLLVCADVIDHLEGRGLDRPLHFLNDAVWSPEPAVRRAAVRILAQIEAPWARDAIDNARMMDGS